jgi:hypothetical protein
MKFKYLILFLLFTAFAQSQSIHLKGTILDSRTNQPVAAATVNIAKKNLFYPADNNGKFNFNIDKIANTDTISFSCLGYQTKKVIAKDVLNNDIVKLSPAVTVLKEVKIGYKTSEITTVGSKMKSEDSWSTVYPNFEQAMFMEGTKNLKGTIQKVSFYLGNGYVLKFNEKGDVTAPFRLKLYAVDTDGTPGKELTKDIIIVSAKKNNSWFDVDMSAYHIENPDSGFFVAYCLLGKEFYEIKKSYENELPEGAANGKYVLTPRLGLVLDKLKHEQCYEGSNTYWGWEWRKYIYNYSYMIRATIAPD